MESSEIRELVDFERAQALFDFEPPNPSLIVSGVLPSPMRVELEPMREVFGEPEYWPLEVVGYHAEITTPAERPFSKQVSLSKLPQGSNGIEVIGRSRSVNVDTTP